MIYLLKPLLYIVQPHLIVIDLSSGERSSRAQNVFSSATKQSVRRVQTDLILAASTSCLIAADCAMPRVASILANLCAYMYIAY